MNIHEDPVTFDTTSGEITILTEDGVNIKLISLHAWDNWEYNNSTPPVIALYKLQILLRAYDVHTLWISEDSPNYLRVYFVDWPYEDYKIGWDVWDWLEARADAARFPKKICWQKVGF